MKDTYRHKTDWDFVEWLIEQLGDQLGTYIRKKQQKRESARIASEEYRNTPEGRMKRLEYARRYSAEHSAILKRQRDERKFEKLKKELEK